MVNVEFNYILKIREPISAPLNSHLIYCFSGKREVAEFLIKIGADVDIVDSKGWTPLRAAAENSNF